MLQPGDRVAVRTEKETIEGILIPSPAKEIVVLKLDSGYNIGIKRVRIKRMRLIRRSKRARVAPPRTPRRVPGLPTIAILHTGGTIASRVDYRTGAVVARFSPAELLELFPELRGIANIRSRFLFQMFSEDIEPEHWAAMARAVRQELATGAEGVIVTHGTDTLHYSSAALAFMLQDLRAPVLFVGAQRSIDRPSSDAFVNLLAAAQFIAKTDWAGVGVCMHRTPGDDSCLIHPGTKVRKMHSSRRDAFATINASPIAEVWPDGRLSFFVKGYTKRGTDLPRLETRFERAVALVKLHPGFDHALLDWHARRGIKGLVLEGTGLGHAPITALDRWTARHPALLKKLAELVRRGALVVMTSQCLYGAINMHVYSTGRDLLAAGVLPGGDMTPETAYVKLGWLLGNRPRQAAALIGKNLVGEISARLELTSG